MGAVTTGDGSDRCIVGDDYANSDDILAGKTDDECGKPRFGLFPRGPYLGDPAQPLRGNG